MPVLSRYQFFIDSCCLYCRFFQPLDTKNMEIGKEFVTSSGFVRRCRIPSHLFNFSLPFYWFLKWISLPFTIKISTRTWTSIRNSLLRSCNQAFCIKYLKWLVLSCVLWHFFVSTQEKTPDYFMEKPHCFQRVSFTCTAHCISLSRYFCHCHFYNTHKYSSTLFIQSTHTTIKDERIKRKEQNTKRRTWCMDIKYLHLTLKVQQYPLLFRNARWFDDDDDDLFLFLKGRILEWIKYFMCVQTCISPLLDGNDMDDMFPDLMMILLACFYADDTLVCKLCTLFFWDKKMHKSKKAFFVYNFFVEFIQLNCIKFL